MAIRPGRLPATTRAAAARPRGGGVTAGQRFEPAHRLLVGRFETSLRVAQRRDIGLQRGDVELVATPDAQPVLGETDELLGRRQHRGRLRLLHARFRREEPTFGDECCDRLPRVFGIELRRFVLLPGEGSACAHAAPQVELPGREEPEAGQAAAVGHLAAAARQ
jgi:hypothetical protein